MNRYRERTIQPQTQQQIILRNTQLQLTQTLRTRALWPLDLRKIRAAKSFHLGVGRKQAVEQVAYSCRILGTGTGRSSD